MGPSRWISGIRSSRSAMPPLVAMVRASAPKT